MVSTVRTVRVHPDRALPEVSYLPGTPAKAIALAYIAARQFRAGTQGGGTQPAASVPACVSSRNAGPIPATCAALGQPGAAAFSRVVALPVLACDRCGDDVVMLATCLTCARGKPVPRKNRRFRRRWNPRDIERLRAAISGATSWAPARAAFPGYSAAALRMTARRFGIQTAFKAGRRRK